MSNLIPTERIQSKIYIIREQRVILDKDLAKLYGVRTKNLNKAVKRNIKRFPSDFMFQLSPEENDSLRFHFGTLEKGKHSKYMPYAFTEQGIAMLSSVLRSERAIQVNVAIMRAFVKIKQFLYDHKELAAKLSQLEGRVGKHDAEIQAIFEAIQNPPEKPTKRIGFLR